VELERIARLLHDVEPDHLEASTVQAHRRAAGTAEQVSNARLHVLLHTFAASPTEPSSSASAQARNVALLTTTGGHLPIDEVLDASPV